jgi:hypothetical protein
MNRVSSTVREGQALQSGICTLTCSTPSPGVARDLV